MSIKTVKEAAIATAEAAAYTAKLADAEISSLVAFKNRAIKLARVAANRKDLASNVYILAGYA